jgi:hypothetical protein
VVFQPFFSLEKEIVLRWIRNLARPSAFSNSQLFRLFFRRKRGQPFLKPCTWFCHDFLFFSGFGESAVNGSCHSSPGRFGRSTWQNLAEFIHASGSISSHKKTNDL